MKKIFLILTILMLISPSLAMAQVKEDDSDNKVDLIKNKVASRVAELKLVEKRGVVGVVESATESEIKVNDLNDKTRIIEVDELTKFNSDEEDNFGISDIKEGTKISAIGLYNKDSQKLLARFVNEISIPVFLNGVISDKDEENFTIELSTEDEKKYTVDIEKITKSFSYSDGDLETSGFTKIEMMQNALVIGYTDPKDENKITASRIIIFPDVPKNPRIEVENKPAAKPSAKPSKSPTSSPNTEE